MAIDAGQAGLISMWRSIKATAEWNSDLGLQKAWSQHVEEWGPPLEIRQATVWYNGKTVQGRTFLKIGMVIWDDADGAVVVGWQPLPQ
jgi:hypothetical protein